MNSGPNGVIVSATRGAAGLDTSYTFTCAAIPAPEPTRISTLLSPTLFTRAPFVNSPTSATPTLEPPLKVAPNGFAIVA